MSKNIDNSKKNNEDMPRYVRNYLFVRTIVAFIAAYCFDLITHTLVQKIIYPFFNRILLLDQLYFHVDADAVGRASMLDLLRQIVYLALGKLFRIRLFVPSDSAFVSIPAVVAEQGNAVIGLYMTIVVLSYTFMFLVSLLPFFLVGLWMFREIIKLIDKLRKADSDKRIRYEKERNLMLADMAHDIKTPITSVVGVAKALDDGIVPEDKVKTYLHTVYSKSMRISELTNQLFEYVKMDSEGYSLSLSELDYGQLVLECCAESYTDFEDAGIELVIDVPEKAMPLKGDKSQLRRVINNLLANETKYLDDGRCVFVKMSIYNNSYLLAVSDNSNPIEDNLIDNIFEPFSRGDSTRSTKGGSGLGLSIARKIVSLHNGNMEIEQPGRDGYTKTFVIAIPMSE